MQQEIVLDVPEIIAQQEGRIALLWGRVLGAGFARETKPGAWKHSRKGRRYGTILVDLEQHRVLALLPDATATSLATWPKAHPGIEIISRDRAGVYAEGARQGAPNAVQVADHWHLLKNLSETLERVLDQNRAALQQAAPALQEPLLVAWSPTKGKTAREESRQRRQKRLERYEQVVQLRQQRS